MKLGRVRKEKRDYNWRKILAWGYCNESPSSDNLAFKPGNKIETGCQLTEIHDDNMTMHPNLNNRDADKVVDMD